jgi:hypothetical protein
LSEEQRVKGKGLTVVVFDFESTRIMNHHQTQYSVAVAVAAVQIKRVLFPFLVAEAGLCQWMCHSQMLTLAEGGFLNSTNLQRRAVLLLQVAADQQSPSTSQKGQGHYRSGSIDREEMYLVAVAALRVPKERLSGLALLLTESREEGRLGSTSGLLSIARRWGGGCGC